MTRRQARIDLSLDPLEIYTYRKSDFKLTKGLRPFTVDTAAVVYLESKYLLRIPDRLAHQLDLGASRHALLDEQSREQKIKDRERESTFAIGPL